VEDGASLIGGRDIEQAQATNSARAWALIAMTSRAVAIGTRFVSEPGSMTAAVPLRL
jgi:hypothetical protein